MSLKSLVVAGCSLMLSGEAAAQKTPPPKSISQMERTCLDITGSLPTTLVLSDELRWAPVKKNQAERPAAYLAHCRQ
jgi:hypothetical protein